MQRPFPALLALPALLLAACANFSPKVPPPEAGAAPPIYFSDRLPTDMEKTVTYSVPESYFGVTPHQRGSAAVGLLFGPFGVAANVAYMQDAAKRASAGGEALFGENLPQMVNGAAPRYGMVTANDRHGRRYEVTPSVALQFESDTEYTFTCNTWVYLFDGQTEVWKARYAVSLGHLYSAALLGSDTALRDDIRTCIVTSLALFDLHRTSGPESYQTAEMDIGYGTFTMPVVKSLLPGRVVMNDPAGLWEPGRQVKAFALK